LKTMFQLCFYFCIVLILFNLGWGFVRGIEGVWSEEGTDQNVIESDTEEGIINEITGLSVSDLSIWGMLTGVGLIAAGAFSWMVQSLSPIGIYIFSVGFWASYNGTATIIGMHGWLPGDFILLITVGMFFLFLGAVIGMISGSG